ncbi:MAG: hypothetical protein H8E33_01120 [Candidatus Cloacimonetes bacterium]|nr:hypothetical protein [Candidatus Cloacimonadota bacterium]
MKIKMKKLFMLLILPVILNAQIQWQNEGVPIRQGVNIEWSRSATLMSDGSVIYVWSDTRMGDRDVWAQKVDEEGNLLWGDDGILVNGELNRQEDPVVINTNDGCIVVWIDFRNEDAGDVYAQKLDNNGNLLWNESGISLCLAEDIQISLNIVNDNSGGAYVIWLDSRNTGGKDIYGTHIDSSGNIVAGWTQDGNPIAAESGAQDGHTFWEDGDGGAILAWHDTRNADNEDIYIQRILADGTLLFGEGGIPLCNAVETQENVKIAPDGTGSFILVWRDKRNENDGDIFAQRIDLYGNLIWENEKEIYVGSGIQQNPRITSSSDGGAIIVWEDGRNDPYFVDIYSQKIDVNGNLIWSETGIPLCTSENDQSDPRLINDRNGGCHFVWADGRNAGHPYEDIYLQHLDSSGNALLQENGESICDESREQSSPLLRRNNNGNLFSVWADNRTGSTGIYLQILDENDNLILNENGEIIFYGLCGDAKNYEMIFNGNQSIIVWEDTRNPYIGKKIYIQVLNDDGSINLSENGFPIALTEEFAQENPNIILSFDMNQTVIVWEEQRDDNKHIYAQSVDVNGNLFWSENGLLVSTFDSDKVGAKISSESSKIKSTNYYIGWTDHSGDLWNPVIQIRAQKIQDGEVQWGDEGISVADFTGDDVLTDLVGRYFIWQNEEWNNFNIYAKLLDADGNAAEGWNENGLPICEASGNQQNAKGIMTEQGLLVVWEDLRNGNLDIYGQIINSTGEILWQENGLPLVVEENDQTLSDIIFDNEIYLLWKDFRSGIQDDIYMQKFDADGSELWQSGGIPVVDEVSNQVASCVTNVSGKFSIFWEDYRDGDQSNLYAQTLDCDGICEWENDGIVVCNSIKKQNQPIAVSGENNSYVIWEDTRSSGKTDIYNIYAQKIYIESDQSIIYGDVNGDENVSSFDAALTLQYSAGLISDWTENQITAGDVDGNENVSSFDAALILQYSAGIIDEFPVE